MTFIRKIKVKDRIYLAEVENTRIKGKCVQKHIRYIGKQADGKTVLSSSISDAKVESVKLYGPLLVLNYLAEKISLKEHLGKYGKEILSMVYAHCLDYKSITQMKRWYSRTDLAVILDMEDVTEKRLLNALDSLEAQNCNKLQKDIFASLLKSYNIPTTGVIYDVTNTYLYGKKCSLGKMGHDKEGVKGRPLIQIGLVVTKDEGIPVCHKVFDGNISDVRTFQDVITDLKDYAITRGLVIYDRGIMSAKNIKDISDLGWHTICGVPIRGKLIKILEHSIVKHKFIAIENRIKLNQTIFYAVTMPYEISGVKGFLTICFNEQQKQALRESRYDEILYAQQLILKNKKIKPGMEKYFSKDKQILEARVLQAEKFDGYSCIFSTYRLDKKEIVPLYFDKDLVEKSFRTIKGITSLRPIRHWLYNRVIAHIFICYLSYMLLSLLQHKLKVIDISSEEALIELDTMYKVYLKDPKKNFQISRSVALTKKQELILKTIDPRLLKLQLV